MDHFLINPFSMSTHCNNESLSKDDIVKCCFYASKEPIKVINLISENNLNTLYY